MESTATIGITGLASGDMTESTFTEKQKQAIDQFRERLMTNELTQGDDEDDYQLYKWLKARGMDIMKAETMYKESKDYKCRMRVDTLLDDYTPPKVIEDYLAGGYCGFDKQGSPIRIELFGRLDMKGLMRSCKKSDLEKSKLLQCEKVMQMCREQSGKLGRRVDNLTVIFDMDQVGTAALWKPGLDMYLHLVKVLEDNYPEMMKRMYVINAPSIFPILYKICTPLISEDMKDKIKVIGGDYKSVLLNDIDADQLPACFGGTQVDANGDPRCSEKICQGGPVPQGLYLSGTSCSVSGMDQVGGMETCNLSPGRKITLDFVVDKSRSVLKWEFISEDHDVGFGVLRFLEDNSIEPIVPVRRYNCHQVAQDGSMVCEEQGTYGIVFDNRHSWLRSKTIYYTLLLNDTPCSLLESEG